MQAQFGLLRDRARRPHSAPRCRSESRSSRAPRRNARAWARRVPSRRGCRATGSARGRIRPPISAARRPACARRRSVCLRGPGSVLKSVSTTATGSTLVVNGCARRSSVKSTPARSTSSLSMTTRGSGSFFGASSGGRFFVASSISRAKLTLPALSTTRLATGRPSEISRNPKARCVSAGKIS